MKKTRKRLLIFFFIVAVILSTGYTLYRVYLRPEVLTTRISQTLAQKTGKPVKINSLSIDTWSRPVVYLNEIELGDAQSLYLKSRRARIRISPWYLLLGAVKVKNITLQNPLLIIHPGKLTPEQKASDFPLIRTSGARLKLIFEHRTLEFHDLQGSISPKRINLDARLPQGAMHINALKIAKTWNGGLSINGLNLRQLSEKTAGIADVKILFRSGLGKYSAAVSAHGRNLLLPWGAHIPETGLRLLASGDKHALALSRIDFKHPVFSLKGTATFTGLSAPASSTCELNLETNEFSYEEFIRLLPVQHLDEGLRVLLTRDIRDGRFQATRIHYAGKLAQIKDVQACMRNLQIEGRLAGLSYAAGPGRKRVTGVSGAASARKGTLAFRHLSGTMGKSMVKEVNLIFPDVASPGFRTDIEVDISMPAHDFLDTWRASVTEPGVTALLDPVKQVTGGTVSGRVAVHYDEFKHESQIKGAVSLQDTSFSWNSTKIRRLRATAHAANYQAPAIITGALTWDDIPVDAIAINLMDPLGRQAFSFSLRARDIISAKDFRLAKDAVYELTGQGAWPQYTGELRITSKDMRLSGYHIRPATGVFRAAGSGKGTLAPQVSLEIPGLKLSLGTSRLHAALQLGETKDTYKLSGMLNLAEINCSSPDKLKPVDGELSGALSIVRHKDTDIRGNLKLRGVRISKAGKPAALQGDLNFQGDLITTQNLKISRESVNTLLSGSLKLGDTPFYTGEIAIDGLALQKAVTAGDLGEDLKKFAGKARLTLTNLHFGGLTLSHGEAQADLTGGNLALTNMQMKGAYGTAAGSLLIPAQGKNTFDLQIALKQAPIEKFLQAFSSEPVWMQGKMDLSGRLWGSEDSLNGDFKFLAGKGRILRYSLLSRIFSVLNPYKMIKSREVDLRRKGFPYNTITASFTIRDSELRYNDFYLDSNSLQLSALGTYRIKSGHIDAVLGVQPLETMDKTLGMIPVVGWVLTGERGMLLVVSLRVSGQIDEPAVKILPANTISKPVAQTLLRILKLPVDLVTKPGTVFLPGMRGKHEPGPEEKPR